MTKGIIIIVIIFLIFLNKQRVAAAAAVVFLKGTTTLERIQLDGGGFFSCRWETRPQNACLSVVSYLPVKPNTKTSLRYGIETR